MMTAKGLAVRSPNDCVPMVLRIAATVTGHRASRFTHAIAASRLLAAMEAEAIVSYSKSRREKLVAMLGSFIGNTLALTECQASDRPGPRAYAGLLGTGVAVGLRQSQRQRRLFRLGVLEPIAFHEGQSVAVEHEADIDEKRAVIGAAEQELLL